MGEDALLNLIMGAGAGLSGSVAILFNIVMKQNLRQTEISKKLGELEGRQDGIANLSNEVIKTVRLAILESKASQPVDPPVI